MHGVPLAHPPGVIFLYPLPSPTPYNWPTSICMETHTHTHTLLVQTSVPQRNIPYASGLDFVILIVVLLPIKHHNCNFCSLQNVSFPLRYKPGKGSPFLLCFSVSQQRKDSEHSKYLLSEGMAKLILLFILLLFLSLYWAFLVLNHHSTFVEQV